MSSKYDAVKRRGASRKTKKRIEYNAKQRQWAGKEAAKEKKEQFRSALQLPFWRRGKQPKVGDYLLAYYPYKKKADSGFFIGKIKEIKGEIFDILFLYTRAVVRTPYHWLKPIYTWMMTIGENKNCLSLEGYDLEKSCVVRFLAKAMKFNYKKNYKGKEPKKRKREVQKQKMPAPATPPLPKRIAMAAAGPSSRQKREKPGPKGDWMRLFYKQETEDDSDSETDDEPEPNEEELPEESVREFKKLLLF